MDDREANCNSHPPTCTCVYCVNKRLKKFQNSNSDRTASVKIVYEPKRTYNSKPTQSENGGCGWVLFLILFIIGFSVWAIVSKHNDNQNIANSDNLSTVTTTTVTSTSTLITPPSIIEVTLPKVYLLTTEVPPTTITTVAPISEQPDKIDSHGFYKNYRVELVNTDKGILSGNGCYDDEGQFIILINNTNATDTTYAQLITFLQQDKTDTYPYISNMFTIPKFYYGSAISHVDLINIQNIINGITQPKNPRVCADFAERLHNEAEKSGIRCGYVSIDLSGVGHACNVFETTDKGIIYVDDTGINGKGPSNCDKLVNIGVGKSYIPKSITHEQGWSDYWDNMGVITNIQVIW